MGLTGGLMLALAALASGSATQAVAEPAGGRPLSLDRNRLLTDLSVLADDRMEGRLVGSEGAARARTYIASRFREMGLVVEQADFVFTPADGRERSGVNLWTTIAGSEAPDRWIVVTAHYDHVGVRDGEIHNGADDNASGVAVLLALAEMLRHSPPYHSVALVAVDAEEPPPGFFGARAWLQRAPVPLDRVLLNVNLDMVSRQDGGYLWAAGTTRHPALRPVLEPLAAEAERRLRLGHDGLGSEGEDWTALSDHAVFHEASIPFVYFGVEDHSDYHGPGDEVEKIDSDFFGRSARTILTAIRRLDASGAALAEARRSAAR